MVDVKDGKETEEERTQIDFIKFNLIESAKKNNVRMPLLYLAMKELILTYPGNVFGEIKEKDAPWTTIKN